MGLVSRGLRAWGFRGLRVYTTRICPGLSEDHILRGDETIPEPDAQAE